MSQERKVYAGAQGLFNERRNTSRVFPVPPGALEEALRALSTWKRTDPEAYHWVASGAWKR